MCKRSCKHSYKLVGGPMNGTLIQASPIRGMIKLESWGPDKDKRAEHTYSVKVEAGWLLSGQYEEGVAIYSGRSELKKTGITKY